MIQDLLNLIGERERPRRTRGEGSASRAENLNISLDSNP